MNYKEEDKNPLDNSFNILNNSSVEGSNPDKGKQVAKKINFK